MFENSTDLNCGREFGEGSFANMVSVLYVLCYRHILSYEIRLYTEIITVTCKSIAYNFIFNEILCKIKFVCLWFPPSFMKVRNCLILLWLLFSLN